MNVGGWLRRLGLEQYEAAFRENAINEAILPKLTAGDLKDIGVAAVGHRRVLLDAIAALRGETPPKQENAPSATTEPAPSPTAQAVAPQKPENRRRASARHGDVLRSRGFNRYLREARRGSSLAARDRLSRACPHDSTDQCAISLAAGRTGRLGLSLARELWEAALRVREMYRARFVRFTRA